MVEAGIPEYWIVDCDTETVEVYRKPADDAYHDVSHVSGAATVTPRAFPDVELALAEIFA